MPALKDPRQEMFAQLRADGIKVAIAYEKAGYNPHLSNCYKMDKKPQVKARVQEILIERLNKERENTSVAVANNGLTKQWVISRLMYNAERCLRGKPELDKNGVQTGRFIGRPDAGGANKALELLGTELGMFKQHHIHDHGDLSRMSLAELRNEIAAECESLGLKVDLPPVGATQH